MTPLSCPGCGLEQPLEAPDCARCGAPLDGAGLDVLRRAMPPGGPGDDADADWADDRTVLRTDLDMLPTSGPTEASASPWGAAAPGRTGQQSWWRRLFTRQRRETPAPPRGEWVRWSARPETRDDE